MKVPTPLVEQACAGDRAAVSELLVACQPDLKRFARRTCVNSEDAEDAVQVALWQMHRKLGTLRSVAALASWLFRIIERECYRLFGGGRTGRPRLEPLTDEPAAPLSPIDLRLDLVAAISELPVSYRTVLILRDVDELTAPETAEQLGISVEAVKSRLHRARATVRERLVHSGYWDASTHSERPTHQRPAVNPYCKEP